MRKQCSVVSTEKEVINELNVMMINVYQNDYIKPCFCKKLWFYSAELFKMVCEHNETDLDIKIPTVMLPQDAGMNLKSQLEKNFTGMPFSAYICPT